MMTAGHPKEHLYIKRELLVDVPEQFVVVLFNCTTRAGPLYLCRVCISKSARKPPTSTLNMAATRLVGYNVANHLSKGKLLVAVNCVAALSIFFFGYDQGMMSGVNNSKDYIELMELGYTVDKDGQKNSPVITDSLRQGGIVAVYYLGTLVGALGGGWVGDKIGRTRTIAVGAAWGVFGAALQASAQNDVWMIFGEFQEYRPQIIE